MEELQEADVLWPETPPPPSQRDHLPPLVVHDTATVFSRESFGDPASSPIRLTSTGLLFGRRRSVASTAAGLDDDVQAEEFQEADVLWPDDVDEDTARDHLDDVGEFRWLCRDFGEAGSHMEEAAAATAGKRKVWRPSLSSPIDIPTRGPTAVLVHRRRR